MRRLAAALMTLVGLGSATMAAGQSRPYPSLERRPVELRDRTAEATAPAAIKAPDPLDAAALRRIEAMTADARSAAVAFDSAMPDCAGAVRSAGGSSPGSEPWVLAQRAISRLDAARYGSVAALAGLDSLYAQALDAGHDTAPLQVPRAAVVALVDAQNDRLDSFRSALSQP